MKSKTKINKQFKRKTNSKLVDTILFAKKNEKWRGVAGILAGPRSKWKILNLSDINKEAKEGETIVVPGKVLSMGNLDKKVKIVAFQFSERTKEKVLKLKGELSSIYDEIKRNPEAKGIKILK